MLFGETKAVLWRWRRALVERLDRFRLTVHPGAHPKPVGEGIPFLGFVIFPDRRRLKRRKGVHYLRRLRSRIAAFAAGELGRDELVASLRGWLNHVGFANTVGLQKAVLRSLPDTVREVISSLL